MCHLVLKAAKKDGMLCVPGLEDSLREEQCHNWKQSSAGSDGTGGVGQRKLAVPSLCDSGVVGSNSEEDESNCDESSCSESSDDEFGQLDIDLERKSKQHNLTSSNVRTILHEVLTHEDVVAMMKAAIKDTQDEPMFEPKMTRARLKQVVQEAESVSICYLSPCKGPVPKLPQFVDILLEDDEDSSDEEYCPDEDDEDETAEETFLSDADSISSSPRVTRSAQPVTPKQESDKWIDTPVKEARCPRHLRVDAVPMGPPPPASSFSIPQQLSSDSSFLERLQAVDQELAFNPDCSSYQLNGGSSNNDVDAGGLVAFRTRSKRPLRDVPLGQLEAELLPPDITPDMYEFGPALVEEDRHWTQWLQGLMASDNEEEVDDDDDPEYHFPEELDEPDQEDYRTGRATHITKKEANELLEELFDTFQEEPNVEEAEEEERSLQSIPKFNVPQALRFEAPLASMLTERRRAVREQYEALQQRRALQDTPTQNHEKPSPTCAPPSTTPAMVPVRLCPSLFLDSAQKAQLQQQVQQHVQLLTQVHLLTRRVKALHYEACLTKKYLEELQQFAQQEEERDSTSSFRAGNLQGATELLQELQEREDAPRTPRSPSPVSSSCFLPRMTSVTSSRAYPRLPAETAWLLATRSVFLYAELLPICSLDPDLYPQRHRTIFTSGEDCLIVLGLKHFEGTLSPHQLLSSYLIRKRHQLLRKRISEMCGPNAPTDNVIKLFFQNQVPPVMPVACKRVLPGDECPSVERETAAMPNWLKKSQPVIQKTKLAFGKNPGYPSRLPTNCTLHLHPSRPPTKTVHNAKMAPIKPSRIFTLAHTSCLPRLAKATADKQLDRQQLSCLANVSGSIPSQGVILLAKTPVTPIQAALPLSQVPAHGTVPFAAVGPVSAHPVCGQASLSTTELMTQSTLIRAPHDGRRRVKTHLKRSVPRQLKKPITSPLHSTSVRVTGSEARVPLPTSPGLQLNPPPLSDTSQSHTEKPVSDKLSCSTNKNPEYLLFPITVSGSAQMLWMPKTCLVPSGTLVHSGFQNWSTGPAPVAQKQDALFQPNSCFTSSENSTHPQNVSSSNGRPSLEKQLCRVVEMLKEEREASVNPCLSLEDKERHKLSAKKEGVKKNKGEELREQNYQYSLERGSKEDECEEGVVTCNGGENSDGEEREGGSGEDGEEEHGGEREGDHGGEETGDGEEEGDREDAQSGGEKEDDGDKDGEQDRQGEEDEEEDFDDLTQDEDEEEVMSSASEESVLSVPELQETMKQLTWLASEGRLCGDADSEEEHSPISPGSQNSQEENSEEEEEGPAKGEESECGEERSTKVTEDEVPSGEGTPRGGGKTPRRGRGRARPPTRRRQERHSKDAAKLLLLYDDHILDNDPHRESKDTAFAQAYLNRVREALRDAPGKVEEFLALLHEFELVGEGRDEVQLFRNLRCILGDRADLLRDFAAFLHPEQALECGLFEEQQAFERSRRFLRQLEISFGDNPSHYQKIIKALQGGSDLNASSVHELKSQMATLLKGHTHLQGEFWVFFDELRPPPARPGQFEEAHWPEEGGGGSDTIEAISSRSGGGANCGFEEVTLPELEEEEEGQKIPPMAGRRRRKIGSHGNYKECDWSDKDWPCLCQVPGHDAKLRRHKRKGCTRCQGNKNSEGVSRALKNLDPLYTLSAEQQAEAGPQNAVEKDGELDSELKDEDDSRVSSPLPEQGITSWEGTDGKEVEDDELEDEEDEDEDERKNSDSEYSPVPKRSRVEEERSGSSESSCSAFCGAPIPSFDPPVCAKNISLTASGEKVILWTREADRVILTTCQQEGANQSTFQAISAQLGNKTSNEVSRRFRDLMRLFRTAARQTNSEDEAPPTESTAAIEEEEEQQD
ncbi:GON-4-like protein [Lampris incognitus]|uniref:GON-4-like protein n=1 Tax=Lampris incognitus TaxID=2546036 RepID=UPI0024B51902|nr:GON-4-like protein [Lampris incognitus]